MRIALCLFLALLGSCAVSLVTPAKLDGHVLDLLVAGRDGWKREAESAHVSAERRAELLARCERFDKVLSRPEEFRVQILVGEIVNDGTSSSLVQNGWRSDAEYFYPASAVKLCGAIAALERLNRMRRELADNSALLPSELPDERTPLHFESNRRIPNATVETSDHSNVEGGHITLEHLIRRVFLVSDNAAFNRLYDFCGQDALQQSMWRAGLPSARISHRLSTRLNAEQNRMTPAFKILMSRGTIPVAESEGTLALQLEPMRGLNVGEARLQGGRRIEGPMSFSHRNRIGLEELQRCTVRVVRPDVVLDRGEPFDLTQEQHTLLMNAMSEYPGDSPNPRYDRAKYPDDYVKFFLPGVARVLPKERVLIYNKVGLAYGFVVDTSYIVDRESGRGFFLAATMYANSDGVVDDDMYDYETFALPFFADLGEVIARKMLTRSRQLAESSRFRKGEGGTVPET